MREINPIHDPSWLGLLERHSRASVFHSPGWLEALRRTYGYVPVVLATSSGSQKEVAGGVVLCYVSSRLTGRRLVSLPFSDHCEPLVDSNEELRYILAALSGERNGHAWKYVEIRPVLSDPSGFQSYTPSKTFCLHRLDLRPPLAHIFQKLHKDCVQRKIWRAEWEGLIYEEGRSELLLQKFYRLLVMTRRRQFLLPQPIGWFRNLIACMGDKLKIHTVSKNGRAVASILTLNYKKTITYKYGCSDKQFSNLGGTHLAIWRAIQQAKEDGLVELDMGRSDLDDAGLIKFKDRWGATSSRLTYWRYGVLGEGASGAWPGARLAQHLFDRVPDGLLARTGSLLYRHAG